MDTQISGEVPSAKPKNWLVESILTTLFCCLPFGIAGIIFAAQVNSKYAAGDYEGALIASNNAEKWTKIGFFVGLAIIIINVVLFALGIGFSGLQGA
jgi:hypothetical protein